VPPSRRFPSNHIATPANAKPKQTEEKSMAIERYTKDHEWIRVEDGIGIVGITSHAQEQLGDIVFVEVPEAGRQAKQGDAVAVVESVKAASDVFAPVSGEVIEVNALIAEQPALVNEDAQGRAWFFKVKISDPAELDALMDEAAYRDFVKQAA
jgi:glycine cleavage system H protein